MTFRKSAVSESMGQPASVAIVSASMFQIALAVAVMCGASGCNLDEPPPPDARFTQISEYGFDAEDNAVDQNDYAWSLVQFTADGSDQGYVYCTTGNAVADNIFSSTIVGSAVGTGLPPEIRRYRPDLVPTVWERVADWRELESGPPWPATGVRGLIAYRARVDGRRYLYAGTAGDAPALWRSPTGEPGSWTKVWSSPIGGSIRCFAEHDGVLYFGLTHERLEPQVGGEIYATDGASVWPIVTDGFGNADNEGVYSLASFNGAVYAGTVNFDRGFEIWKLSGPAGGLLDGAAAVQIGANGVTARAQEAVADLKVFRAHLYVGTIIFFNVNYGDYQPLRRAADLLRINAADEIEVVVGPGSIGGVDSGFGEIANAFTWTLAEHAGRLYCGTWDGDSVLPVLVTNWPEIRTLVNQRVGFPLLTGPAFFGSFVQQGWYDRIARPGGRLYVSDDGVSWERVFEGGLGNPRNYGVRSLLSTSTGLLLGMANIDDGLSVWRFVP